MSEFETCEYRLAIEFTRKVLGTADKGSGPEVLETGFYRSASGKAALRDFQLLGFLKEAASALDHLFEVDMGGKVRELVFVEPRYLKLDLPPSGRLSEVERRRRDDRRGSILVRSEAAPPGTRLRAKLIRYPGLSVEQLRTLLDYGRHHGLGSWRNAGYGRFRYVMERSDSPQKSGS